MSCPVFNSILITEIFDEEDEEKQSETDNKQFIYTKDIRIWNVIPLFHDLA